MIYFWTLICFGFAAVVQPQVQELTKPYLVSASIYISAATQAQVWLNGIHIADCPRTTMTRGYKILEAKPESLCYFKRSNVLAIRLLGSNRTHADRLIAVAYAIELKLSNGSVLKITSSTGKENRCLYLSRGDPEPENWQTTHFNDDHWRLAQSLGDMIPDTALLSGPKVGADVGFLSATNSGYLIQQWSEKQLFRRKFNLDIGVNPHCLPTDFLAPPSRLWPPSSTPYLQPTRSIENPSMEVTPEVLSHQPASKVSAQWHPPPNLNYYPLILIPAQIHPVRTPSAGSYLTFLAKTPIPKPATPSLKVSSTVPSEETITFGSSEANILVTFADGPGNYKVEAMDEKRNHLKTLFDQRIITDSQVWLTWDGKDDRGNAVPVGRYYIVCTKDGTMLQKIFLQRIP